MKDRLTRSEDHPRLCGEKSSGIVTSVPPLGSPPPMRGKVFKSCCIILCSRITPAYAGKSRKWTEIQLHTWDHPRLCGEKPVKISNDGYVTGSPPPMRGKVHLCSAVVCSGRITPAYAGKRGRCLQILQEQEDHPRLCGEKRCTGNFSGHDDGSPPPMRGKVLSQCFLVGVLRITPAYAGKSTQL